MLIVPFFQVKEFTRTSTIRNGSRRKRIKKKKKETEKRNYKEMWVWLHNFVQCVAKIKEKKWKEKKYYNFWYNNCKKLYQKFVIFNEDCIDVFYRCLPCFNTIYFNMNMYNTYLKIKLFKYLITYISYII